MSESVEAAAPEAATADDDLRPAAAQDAPDSQPAEAPEAETPETEPPEEEEFRFGAKAIKLPKGALPEEVAATLREFTEGVQGDYTRKTQAVAEQARMVAAEREALTRITTLAGEAQQAAVAAQVFDAQAKALREQLPALWQSNPDQARRASDEAAMYEAAAAQNRETVAKHQAEWAHEQQRLAAKQLEAGQAEVRAAIKGFDAKAESELIRYAVETYGFPEAEARNYGLTPKVAVAMWKAMQWDRLQAATKGATAPKQPAAPAGPIRPIAGKNAPAARDPEKMSDEEWVRWRNQQIAKRRA